MLRYLLSRLITVGVTIALGVLITILLANRDGAIDLVVENDIRRGVEYRAASGQWGDLSADEVERRQQAMEESAGLHLPYIPRHLRWLGNALAFRWGEASARTSADVATYTSLSALMGPSYTRFRVTQIIATRLPFTVLLIGMADLIVFLAGIPLALYLARRHGKWPDRLVGVLTPLASIPSWMHGILLVFVFAFGLHILPSGGIYDQIPPETRWQAVWMVARHIVLPVAAILLTLFLQCVAAWRAFFLTYATEDYVELATAKGLSPRTVERRYLLRPALPYILTSFSLTLLGFWQMTTALEYFFNWPGIGQAYVQAIQTSDVVVAVGIVVIFAYLLGLVIILLDLAYAIVDPRIRLGGGEQAVQQRARRAAPRPLQGLRPALPDLLHSWRPRLSGLASALRDGCGALRQGIAGSWVLFRRLLRIPSAVAGLAIIAGLLAMSVYALAANPRASPITGEMLAPGEIPRPRNALPVWVNWFRAAGLPTTIALDTRDGEGTKEARPGEGETYTIRLTLSFDYPYTGLPQEIMLRLLPSSSREIFVSPRWITPDGRQIPLKARSLVAAGKYDISESIPQRYVQSHALRDRLSTSRAALGGQGGLPIYAVLFTDPAAEAVQSLPGRYTLQVDAVAFEPGADLDAQLILLGRVWGWAGTDDQGGDQGAALLWGAPAALVIGLAGGIAATLISLVAAAAGAWFGGALDGLIERLTEATMVLPVLAIAVILQRLFGFSLWLVMGTVVLVSALGTPLKAYRAAFLQVKREGYIEAAQAYGATNARIVFRYMIPRIAPMVAPQLAILVPGFVFLEATLAIFGVSGSLPTWGNLIYRSLQAEVWRGNYLALIEPLALCLLAGLGFALLASPLDRILNPRLQSG